MNAEFDCYIKNYRKNLDQALALSGETSIYFAEYKALKLKEWLPEKATKPLIILDFGCGDGVMTACVAHYLPKATVYGVDPSPESVKTAQEQFPTIHFSTNYDEKSDLDFKDGMFDVVFAAGAFHHIPFEKHVGYLKEIFRVLKPDGAFVMFELNPFNPLTVHTFKRNVIDQHANMLKPKHARTIVKSLMSSYSVKTKFYCFYPHFLKYLRWTERFMTKIPFGALYAIVAYGKQKNT